MINAMIGARYYKYDDEKNLIVLRILRIKNEDKYIVSINGGDKQSITKSELKEYTYLRPDGYFSVCLVRVGITTDVLVTMHRYNEINNPMPYCFCRQNMSNVFIEPIKKQAKTIYIGCSMSKDTCPEGIPYDNSVLACDSSIKMSVVNYYVEDSLGDILKLINLVNYDSYLREAAKIIYKNNIDPKVEYKYIGACVSVKELLETTSFMKEVHNGFKIIDVENYVLNIQDEGGSLKLSPQLLDELEGIIKHKILNYIVYPYSREINLTKAKRDYITICTPNNSLFVMIYDKGNYINPQYDTFEDKSELTMLTALAKK